MNLKLTNQQKQYLMYFAIFILGYLMCMYYPVHNRNNNVPMPIVEGLNHDSPQCVLKEPCHEDIVTAAGGRCEEDNPCSDKTTETQCNNHSLCEWHAHTCEGEECCGEGLEWDGEHCQTNSSNNNSTNR